MLAGACLTALALALSASPAGRATEAESLDESTFTVGFELSRSGAERPTLAVRGHRSSGIGASGPFEVSANVSRIPCAGVYRFEAGQENTRNGNSASYSARIRLLDPEPPLRCGIAPPPLPGEVEVSLTVRESELFHLRGERHNAGLFEGTLNVARLPECGQPYRLEARLDLAGWDRSVDFKVRILEVDATFQGKPVFDEKRC